MILAEVTGVTREIEKNIFWIFSQYYPLAGYYVLFYYIDEIQGVPKNMGIQWRIRYRLCYELALQYLISKALILICLLEFILWKM